MLLAFWGSFLGRCVGNFQSTALLSSLQGHVNYHASLIFAGSTYTLLYPPHSSVFSLMFHCTFCSLLVLPSSAEIGCIILVSLEALTPAFSWRFM